MSRITLPVMFLCLVGYGCGSSGSPEGKAKSPATQRKSPKTQKSLSGMTVNELGDYVKKHHGMDDASLASAMGDSAYEIFGNPKDNSAPKLVVSWTADEEGTPIVDSFVFTTAKLPPLEDDDLVIEFCSKALQPKANGNGQKSQ